MKRLTVCFSLLLLFFCGCSNDSGPNLCADVVCDVGVCNGSSGVCDNPSSCNETTQQCLPGFECQDAVCESLYPCDEQTECERGVCDGTACRNAELCSVDEACLPQNRCEEGSCVFDLCADVECDRGVCDQESGECVNRQVCNDDTETTDCLEGQFCYGQACQTETFICDDLACERGVCDPQNAACTDAENCQTDMQCLEGNFCDADSSCRANDCLDDVSCMRGVCEPETATCVNRATCDALDDCTDGFWCVGDSCIDIDNACTDCDGNQVCVYSEVARVADCTEAPGGCGRGLDCIGERVCVDGQCEDPTACSDDGFEPNDDVGTATRIATLPGNLANASLCDGDQDVFLFDTDESPVFTGTFTAAVRIDPVFIGNGNVTLKVTNPNGDDVEVTTDENGFARIDTNIGVLDFGEYTITVTDAGVETSGVDYALFADLIDETAATVCSNATALQSNTPVNGNSSAASSFALGSSCTTPDNPAGEDVYFIDVPEFSFVQVFVTPDTGVDISVSIRTVCEAAQTDLSCEDSGPSDIVETARETLAPGRYFVIVQGPRLNTGGAYTIEATVEPIICSPADNACVDENTARFCNGTRTAFETEMCELGCEAPTGLCALRAADGCPTAVDASAGIIDTIDFTRFSNRFDPGINGCVVQNDGVSQTGGRDAVYSVTLQPDGVLSAVLDPDFRTRGSLYLLEDCNDTTTCIASSNVGFSGDETIVYANTSAVEETVYVVVDSEDRGPLGVADILIETGVRICTPSDAICNGDNLDTCNLLGTGFDQELCTFGCSAGACNPVTNDECTGALPLTPNTTFSGRIDEFTNDYDAGFQCFGRTQFGRDAVYQFTSTVGGEIATIDINATFDVGLWVSTGCSNSPTCLVGQDRFSTNNESLQFVTDPNTTYYVFVDTASNGFNGTYNLSMNLQQPTCTAGDLLGCSDATTLQFCGPLGIPIDYTCSSTCTGLACDAPVGEICFDSISVAAGNYTGDFQGTNSLGLSDGIVDSCFFNPGEAPDGIDTFYKVDLVPGDTLFADFTSTTSLAIMYILGGCETGNCLMNTVDGLQGSLQYEATTFESVYVVMDRTSGVASTSTYSLDIDIRQPDCVPGTPTTCEPDGVTIRYCDSDGFSHTYACSTTCTGGFCDVPQGDVCADAIPITDGVTVSGTFNTQSINDVQPKAPRTGFCQFDNAAEPIGSEAIYVIQAPPGGTVNAQLTTSFGPARLYLMTDCFETDTCQSNNFNPNNDSASYFSPNGGPVYVVVDTNSTFSSSVSYDLRVDIFGGGICTPNRIECDTPNSVTVCDSSGTQFQNAFSCLNGCQDGGCVAEAAADNCITAPTAANGAQVYGRWSDYTNDVDLSFSSCTNQAVSGPDLFYNVSLTAGQVLHVSNQNFGIENTAVYIITDCADAENSCITGARGDDSDRAELFYATATPQTVTVGIDSSSGSDEEFSALIEILNQECTPGQPEVCSGQGLEFCNDFGLLEFYPCQGGCTNGACDIPSGDRCFDAIELQDGDTVSGSFQGNDTIRYSGDSGLCTFGSGDLALGPDTIYSVDLLAGERLSATYTAGTSFAQIYVMSDCDDVDSCLTSTPRTSTGSLQYVAPVDETVFLVMDRSLDSSSTASFTLTVAVELTCAMGSPPSCNGDVLEFCPNGILETYDCTGTCSNGACDTPTGGACIDAIPSSGGMYSGNFSGENNVQPTSNSGSCTFGIDIPIGVDYIYEVDLLSGEMLTADLTSTSSFAMVYIMGECGENVTCKSNSTRGVSGSTSYTAGTDETVYVIVDRSVAGEALNFTWDLELIVL